MLSKKCLYPDNQTSVLTRNTGITYQSKGRNNSQQKYKLAMQQIVGAAVSPYYLQKIMRFCTLLVAHLATLRNSKNCKIRNRVANECKYWQKSVLSLLECR